MRDFWQLVLDYVDWRDFLCMRLLCKRFAELSLKHQRHWYNWLCFHGKPGGFRYDLATHNKYGCRVFDSGELCKDHRHYSDIQPVPRILKTVPLSKQVLQQCAKREQRSLNALMGKAMRERDNFERLVSCNRQIMEDCKKKLTLVDELVVKHASKRKKTHIEINISNLGDDN